MSTSPTKTSKKGFAIETESNANQNSTSTSTSPPRIEGNDEADLLANGEDLTFAKCKVCQKLLHNNRECQHCHGLFCFDHLKQKLQNAPECPNCHKNPVSMEEDYVHNFIVQRLVNETVIPCPMGCGAKFQYSEMQNHSGTCTKSIVPCPMVKYGCDWTGERGQVRTHAQNTCPYHRMKNVLDNYEEKLQQRDMIIQQQKKYVEELVMKKDMHILHLTRELQHAQSLLQRYGINISVHDSLGDISRPQMFSDLLDRRDQFMQPIHHSLFGEPMNPAPISTLNDLIISPANKNSNGNSKIQQQPPQQPQQHQPSPIGKKNYASVVTEGNGPLHGLIRRDHKLFDEHISMSPINGFNIASDVVDSPDDDLLNDNIVNQVISDMDDENRNGNGDDDYELPATQQDDEDDSDDAGETKTYASTTSASRQPSEKLATPVDNTQSNAATRYLLAGGGVGSIKVWDISDIEDCVMSLKGHTRFVSALHTHQGQICSGSGDTSIRLWDFATGECEQTLSGCDGKVGALCSYNNVLVSGSKDGATNHKIRLWNTEKGQCVRTLQGHSDWINVLCAHDKMLFSGSGDRIVRIWDLERGKCLLKYENPSFVLSLYHHAGHNLLYCGTYDGMIRTWDLRVSQGKVIRTVKAHGSGVLSLAHHDGLLCSGSKDETIRVWDYRTLGMSASAGSATNKWGANNNNNSNSVRTFVGHNNAVKCLISYNNRYLASGSYDRTVKLWDVTSASVSNDFSSGDEGMSGEDVSVLTIETGFKVYSLATFDDHAPNV